ncbi:MAG: heme o synthase [Verrucomicrobiota bacterium]|nr:heme o synthase [Verrucomicrobiota bacterium]
MSAPDVSTSSRPTTLTAESTRRARWRDFFEMTKPRLSLLSVITTIFGYLVARPERNLAEFFTLLIGTAMAAGGAAVLNEWMEYREDGLMRRTANRPIPSGAISPAEALTWGLFLGTVGPLLLWWGVNLTAMLLAFATLAGYLVVYTPLKKKTSWNTEIGAIPGAIPPMIGWVAAHNTLGAEAWYLFGILFAWQVSHFMAISWNYREDYKRGGFRMLSLDDATGRRSGLRAVLWAAILLAITLVPIAAGWTGWIYLIGAPVVSLWMLIRAIRFYTAPNADRDRTARRLFWASIAHLPLFLIILTVDCYL